MSLEAEPSAEISDLEMIAELSEVMLNMAAEDNVTIGEAASRTADLFNLYAPADLELAFAARTVAEDRLFDQHVSIVGN